MPDPVAESAPRSPDLSGAASLLVDEANRLDAYADGQCATNIAKNQDALDSELKKLRSNVEFWTAEQDKARAKSAELRYAAVRL